MLRLRCLLCVPAVAGQRRVIMRSQSWVSVRYVGSSSRVHARFLGRGCSFGAALSEQHRWMRVGAHKRAAGSADETSQGGAEGEDGAPRGDRANTTSGIHSHIQGLKEDIRKFPDIYNSANAFNFILFTAFCLCSTGSNVEEKWWMDNWGIDATFAPWAWLLHSFMMNNFLSAAFSMLLLHTMCHSVLPTIGSRGLVIYCVITAVTSGFIMWVGNKLANNTSEKQFGPWDIVAALFVMQYLHQGFTPVQILNSFTGWLRYACWVGAVCIAYYDWQPTAVGTLMGLALCKGHPRFRVTTGAV
ncbi:uncharacterized protein TEOVI_000628400 [Trypanosoma equiperdum]|uniref:Transmembrane protein n=2 Tax=Trypanozoon TaxID=39700 RepID=Q581D5_TRYB2|nr:hypothetical protein, conserved [Trypanosoma brucei brucei TREU927]AAX78918.1 hypothetical protein, conserved [Trypanosoma brucei]AAZ13180.1 hypothetical protein, conserved [Trypanosoma brucei brucei TREU927]SCU68977.1 hypothetical protein, conserved [Trypanosoma equiperdum]